MTLRALSLMPLVAGIVLTLGGPGVATQVADHQSHQGMGHPAASPADPSAELRAQLDAVRAATQRFRDHAVAVAEGYTHVGGDGPLMGEHWVRKGLTDKPFDISAPSTLQYLEVDGARVLTGVAYTVYRAPGEPLPEGFAGDTDQWHVHDLMKISMTATEGRPLLRWMTNRRIARGRTQWDEERPELTMVHAWAWLDNPDGVFAQDHRAIPYVRAGLPQTWATDASSDAAYGVALLGKNACDQEVRKTNFLAGATWRQRRDLTRACEAAEARVRAARRELPSDLDRAGHETPGARAEAGRALNDAAQAAWRSYLARRAELLTEEQTARLEVMIEHPAGHGGGL